MARRADAGGERLTVHVRSAAGEEPAVAELVGAWLDTGDGARFLPIAGWNDGPDGMVARCTAPPDHDVRVVIRAVGERRLRVTVEDRIGVRVRLAGLGAAWRLLADGAPDEIVAPLLHPGPEDFAGDAAFRAPFAYTRAGSKALAILPDLEVLARDRRLPQALRVEIDGGGAWILHAMTALRTEIAPHTARTVRDPERGIRVRDEVVRIAHDLVAFADARPGVTANGIRSDLWRRRISPGLGRSATPLTDRSWDDIAATTLDDRLGRDLRHDVRRGVAVAYLVDPDTSTDETATALLSARRNLLRDAVAAARVAERSGSAERRDTAVQLARFALLAPRRGGLTPHAFRLRVADGQLEWVPGDPDGPRPDAFDAADAAATAVLLLELAELLPELRTPVRDATAPLARFLLASQRADGALPGVYDRQHLAPAWLHEDAAAGATAGPALFLIRFGQAQGDPDAHAAAARAIRFVHARAIDEVGPIADPSRFRAVFRDGRTGAPVRDLVPTASAALAAVALAETDPSFATVASDLLAALAELQQVWSPPWASAELTGGFGGSNADVIWNADGQTTAARAMLAGYRVLGGRERLERGAAALRSALAEPSPWVPGERERPDPLPAAAAAVAIAECCRAEIGQAVVDLDEGIAIGLDALWFEEVAVRAERARFRSTTHACDLDSADLLVRGSTDIRIEVLDHEIPLIAALGRRTVIRPRCVPIIEFRPPAAIAAERDWRPEAAIHGRFPTTGLATLEVFAGPDPIERIPMVIDPRSGRLVAEEPFRPPAPLRGETLRLRVLIASFDRRVTVPAEGFREVRVGDMACIDPGDDLETHLVESTAGTRVARFVDGRENAREADTGGSFTYALPVSRDAAVVELQILSSGALAISGGPDGRALHEDLEAVPPGDRIVPLRLADPRLWPEGELALRFRATGTGAAVARIEYLDSGITERAGAGTPRELTAPDLRIELLVLPIGLGGTPAPEVEPLRQALVGAADYRITPEPHATPTSGSLARWIAVVSGGRTAVDADILDPWRSDEPLAALRDADGWQALLAAVDAPLSAALQARPSSLDAVVLVHPGGPLGAPADLTIGKRPLLILPEREPDGSYLSVGRIAREILIRLRGLDDLGSGETGAFGQLALTANAGSHTPPGPAGVNLVRTGWASLVDVGPGEGSHKLRVPPLFEGRTVVRVETPAVAQAGELFLETRRPTSPTQQQLDGSRPGLLAYRRFAPDQAPVVRLLDGRSVRPLIWRLSRTTPTLHTPFEPARGEGLFADASRLDDIGSPSLATPRGETPWTLDHIGFVAGSTASLGLRWHGVDLLRDVRRGWSGGVRNAVGPVVEGAADAGAGRVVPGDRGPVMIPPARPGGEVRGVFEHASTETGERLFVTLENIEDGLAAIEIELDEAPIATVELPPGRTVLTADLPAAPAGRLEIVLRRIAGTTSVRLTELLTVPRSASALAIALPELPTSTARLSDGTFHARVHTLHLDRHGSARTRVPVLPPLSRGALRIVCGTGHRDEHPCTLRIDLRGADGRPPIVLHDGLEIPASADREVPLTVALCELPEREVRALAFLQLEVRGTPGAVLHFVTLEIDRP